MDQECTGDEEALTGMPSASNLSSIPEFKSINNTIFRLKISASNTLLALCYEDDDYQKLLSSAQFKNFVLDVNVRMLDIVTHSSLGACDAQIPLQNGWRDGVPRECTDLQ